MSRRLAVVLGLALMAGLGACATEADSSDVAASLGRDEVTSTTRGRSPSTTDPDYVPCAENPDCAAAAGATTLPPTTTTAPPTTTTTAPPTTTTTAPPITTTTAAPEDPEVTNARRSAQSYLDMMAFSRQGLIDQLSSEYGDQYPVEAATAAVDSLSVDWNAEAVEAAESYLEFQAFSHAGLVEQLSSEYGDQFTPEQAEHGATVALG